MNNQQTMVERFLSQSQQWADEIQAVRAILLDCGLEEELKWGKPCFMFEGKNIALIQPFKKHCSLMFFKGMLMEDTHGLLRSQGENTQSAMRLEFTRIDQIKKSVVKLYVKNAIAVEKAGLKVDFNAKRELQLPVEFSAAMNKNKQLAKAFQALTPGRQRAYAMHFADAKLPKTRVARIEKCIPKILVGKGLSDPGV